MNINIPDFLSQINWTNPSWDLFIILFFIVAAFLYGLSLGRDRIIVILLSIYMALAVVNSAPYIKEMPFSEINIKIGQSFAFQVTLFLIIFVVLFFFLSRSALVKTIGATESPGSWWQVILFSFLHVGLLISVILSFLPVGSLTALAPLTQAVFASELGGFFWIITPIIAMVLVKKD